MPGCPCNTQALHCCARACSSRGAQAAHCSGFSCGGARGLRSKGLSCRETCGILVHRPGIKQVSHALAGRFLTSGPQGKSSIQIFLVFVPSLWKIALVIWQQIALGRMVILTILILPTQEHRLSFPLFVPSSISFISILEFLEYRSFVSLGRFIPRYFYSFWCDGQWDCFLNFSMRNFF